MFKKEDILPLILDKAYLICNDYNEGYDYNYDGIPKKEDKRFGFGLAFEHKGKKGRIAIRMPEAATAEDYKNAFKRLEKITQDENELNKYAIWGRSILVENEIDFTKEE